MQQRLRLHTGAQSDIMLNRNNGKRQERFCETRFQNRPDYLSGVRRDRLYVAILMKGNLGAQKNERLDSAGRG